MHTDTNSPISQDLHTGARPYEPEMHQPPLPAEEIHLPPPTIWPVTTALGVAGAGMGMVTIWQVSVVGLILMFTGIFNWIQELRHEHH